MSHSATATLHANQVSVRGRMFHTLARGSKPRTFIIRCGDEALETLPFAFAHRSFALSRFTGDVKVWQAFVNTPTKCFFVIGYTREESEVNLSLSNISSVPWRGEIAVLNVGARGTILSTPPSPQSHVTAAVVHFMHSVTEHIDLKLTCGFPQKLTLSARICRSLVPRPSRRSTRTTCPPSRLPRAVTISDDSDDDDDGDNDDSDSGDSNSGSNTLDVDYDTGMDDGTSDASTTTSQRDEDPEYSGDDDDDDADAEAIMEALVATEDPDDDMKTETSVCSEDRGELEYPEDDYWRLGSDSEEERRGYLRLYYAYGLDKIGDDNNGTSDDSDNDSNDSNGQLEADDYDFAELSAFTQYEIRAD
ncbi:hypothetical protein BDN72DRAFT_963878 [Pluteus cervinus]|uniref:Uncharacterized protein n=1 Tax=Pluteus cervinus TaxID=181527 RepID=A0ACD3ADU4_9AGAR|nr:hypothetical protein BDN72DRAFT_963878 [Pluteus cervinus]